MDQILHMDPSPHTDQIPQGDQIPHMDQSPHMNIIVLTTLFRREEPRDMNMSIILQNYVHKSSKNFSAYAYAYPNPSYVKRNGLAALPPFSYGARRVMNSLPPLQMWVVKKRN